MHFDLTRQGPITNLIFVLIMSSVFWSSWIFLAGDFPIVAESSAGTSLGQLIDNWVMGKPSIGIILSAVLVVINSLTITRVSIKNTLFKDRSQMPAIIYLIIAVAFFNSYLSLRPLMASTALILAMDLIYRSFSVKSLATGYYIRIGFYIGLATILLPQLLFMVMLLPISLIIFRPFSIKELFASIVGYILPVFFLLHINWLSGISFSQTTNSFWLAIKETSPNNPLGYSIGILEWIMLVIIFVLFVFAIVKLIQQSKSREIKRFKSYIFAFWVFIASVCMILMPSFSMHMLPILAIPLAIIITIAFSASESSLISNIIFSTIILISAIRWLIPLIG